MLCKIMIIRINIQEKYHGYFVLNMIFPLIFLFAQFNYFIVCWSSLIHLAIERESATLYDRIYHWIL